MGKRKKGEGDDMNNPFAWPFAKHRHLWITKADKFLAVADDSQQEASAAYATSPLGFRKYRKAARYYEQSARYYRKAGLGVMAQGSWQDAATCWACVGEQDECLRCEALADEIDSYWDEEVDQ
jgi:hypothetical protein